MMAMHRAEARYGDARERYFLAARDDGECAQAQVLIEDDARELREARALRKAVRALAPGPLRDALARVPGARAVELLPEGVALDEEVFLLGERHVVLAFYYWWHPGRIPGPAPEATYAAVDAELGALFC